MREKKRKPWDPSASAAGNARSILPLLAARLFEKGRKVAREGATPEELHSFRLAVKRFRYTLEVFRACYGPGLEDRLTRLRRIQNCLGGFSDCAATLARLDAMQLHGSRQVTAFRGFLRKRMDSRAEEFRQYWRSDFDAAGIERSWTAYLSRAAGRTGWKKHK